MVPRRVRRRHADALRRAAERTLDELARSDRPIVAGPWTGGVGPELLYWIPLLGWLTTAGGVEPERVVAISRGGADGWYADVASRYVDLLDHFSLSKINAGDSAETPLPGQPATDSRFDRSAFRLGCDAAGTAPADWLHPALLWRLFGPRWQWRAPGTVVWNRTLHRLLPPAPDDEADLSLPDSYVALQPSFNRSFPDTAENRAFLDELVSELSSRTAIVLLRPLAGSHYLPRGEAVHDASEALTPRSRLGVQTRIVRDARLLLSTYDGFSYLGPFVGTPTLAFYSEGAGDAVHLDAIDRVGRQLAANGTRLFRARHVGAIPLRIREAG